jgi:hypothetical protein
MLLGITLSVKAQVLVHTYVDPCTGNVLNVVVPLNNGSVTVVFRGKSRIVTAQDIRSGALTTWLNSLATAYPCPAAQQAVTQVVTQSVQQATTQATQAATQAASSAAASSASSSAASSAAGSSTSVSGSSSGSSEGGSSGGSEESSSSSSESEGESSSESEGEGEKESEGEGKKDSKKDGKGGVKVNPMVFSSDLSVIEMPNLNVGAIVSLGVSKTSLMGNTSWGATSMIWSNFQQFALSLRKTDLKFEKGKLSRIQNYSFTTVYAFGSVFGLAGYTHIIPTRKGTAGANLAVSFTKVSQQTPELSQLGLGTSVALFYMQPVKVTKRTTLTPDIFVMASPVSYATVEGQFTTSPLMIILAGVSGDLAITKRFKLNWSYKLNYNPAEQTAMSMLNIGTKMNL